VPKTLIRQLAPEGVIVMPVGDPRWTQTLVKVRKRTDGTLEQSDLGGVRFVPLVGEEGWSDS